MPLGMYLDHFYRVVPQSTFDAAKELTQIFPDSEYRKTETPDGDFWEGVYLRSRCGLYFEILTETGYWKKRMFGLCVSDLDDKADVRTFVPKRVPEFDWQPFHKDRPDGQPWIRGAMMEIPGETLFLWAIQYGSDHEINFRRQLGKAPECNIHSIQSLEITLIEDQFAQFGQKFNWIGKPEKIESNRSEYSIQKANGEKFQLIVNRSQVEDGSFRLGIEADLAASNQRSFGDLSLKKSHALNWFLEYSDLN